MERPYSRALRAVVEHFGSQDKAAVATGIPQGTISRWLRGVVEKLPYDAPLKFERASGAAIKAADFYPTEGPTNAPNEASRI
jgi:hypothetical protein